MTFRIQFWHLLFLGLLPIACQKDYSLQPLTPSSSSNPTSSCSSVPTLSCSSGINWNGGELTQLYNGSNYDVGALLNLAVNCNPDSTAAVTITGPGTTLPLTYSMTTVVSGTTYAQYSASTYVGTLTVGVYTMTVTTSSGTAYASITLPSYPTIATDGSSATWSSSNTFNYAIVESSSYTTTYQSGLGCPDISSPFSFPSTAYPAHGVYSVGVECINFTENITGGSGIFYAVNYDSESVTK